MTKPDTRQGAHEIFASPSIRQQLQDAGLGSFEALWTLEAEWVEEPNVRRKGWSGMGRFELSASASSPMGVYLKRQENHGYRSLRTPFRLLPTAYREYRRLVAMQAADIAAPEVLYYGNRRIDDKMQAILMTRAIPPSIPIDDYIVRAGERPPAEVQRLIVDTATLIARFHQHHFQHGSLYGKHVLVSGIDAETLASDPTERHLVPHLIDVEKTRRRLSRFTIAVRDLNQFSRKVPWTTAQWETFLDQYVIVRRMKGIKPVLSWLIQRKAQRKHARREAAAKSRQHSA